ncbi:MAG: hypothetical protein AB4038_11165 [Prochloraceae cyanobacterium]
MTDNWNTISELFSVAETNESQKDSGSETTSSGDNWDAINNLFRTSQEKEIKETITEVALSTEVRRGQLVVEVGNYEGVSFVNPIARTVQVTFVADANATWTFDKNEDSTIAIAGRSDEPVNSGIVAPNLPRAALIAKKETSQDWEMVGSVKTILLQPQEKINFKSNGWNDPGVKYNDNCGNVTIWWFLELTQAAFEVDAAKGYSFSNPFDRKVQLHFVPEGEWKHHSAATYNLPHTGNSDGAKVFDINPNDLVSPDDPVGCLLVGTNNSWQAVGGSKSLTLSANASLDFACNVTKNHSPEGTVTVKWVLERVVSESQVEILESETQENQTVESDKTQTSTETTLV